MPSDVLHLSALAALVLGAAILYSSVGHAGASAYIAAMALFGVPPGVIKPAALVMNIVVAAVGTWRFSVARLVPYRLLLPLCAGSIPAAFAGGMLVLPIRAHRLILGVILLVAAVRLWWPAGSQPDRRTPPAWYWLVALGAVLGLLAGMTGVGGGIFLSPLLILGGFEEPRRTAGASAVFILVNSAAGLLGYLGGHQALPTGMAPLVPVVLLGGLLGSRLGTRHLSTTALRRLLGVVLVIAGAKLVAFPG
jgi:uncharacterized membrane protein YfcA